MASAAALQMVRRLCALAADDEIRRKAAARVLADLSPAQAVALLDEVLALSRQGGRGAAEAQLALSRALELEREHIPHFDVLRQAATLSETAMVERLFSEGEAAMAYDAQAAARADAKLFSEPLGVLKAQARLTRDPDAMARFAVASNASVVRELLKNPRLTEEVVLRIASRRPARPEPLVEIWRSARWSSRPAVRRSLVMNPYLPISVGARIVPLLNRVDLEEVLTDAGLHLTLKQQARSLLQASRV